MFLALFVGIVLELGYFNFFTIYNIVHPQIEESQYTLSQMQFQNWNKQGNILVSETDPALIITGVNLFVNTIDLRFDTSSSIDSIVLFYINDEHPQITEQTMVHLSGPLEKKCRVRIDATVKDLRIDLGDAAGTQLRDFTVTINSKAFDISFSRIIAVVLIYLAGAFLFRIQKMPDYKLEEIQQKKEFSDE